MQPFNIYTEAKYKVHFKRQLPKDVCLPCTGCVLSQWLLALLQSLSNAQSVVLFHPAHKNSVSGSKLLAWVHLNNVPCHPNSVPSECNGNSGLPLSCAHLWTGSSYDLVTTPLLNQNRRLLMLATQTLLCSVTEQQLRWLLVLHVEELVLRLKDET